MTCPITSEMQQLVDIAVEDTYLPISHDLPCISRHLLKEMVGLDIQVALRRNVRNGGGNGDVQLQTNISCVDSAIARAMALKIVRLYDGTDLSVSNDWIEDARFVEARCASNKTLSEE